MHRGHSIHVSHVKCASLFASIVPRGTLSWGGTCDCVIRALASEGDERCLQTRLESTQCITGIPSMYPPSSAPHTSRPSYHEVPSRGRLRVTAFYELLQARMTSAARRTNWNRFNAVRAFHPCIPHQVRLTPRIHRTTRYPLVGWYL